RSTYRAQSGSASIRRYHRGALRERAPREIGRRGTLGVRGRLVSHRALEVVELIVNSAVSQSTAPRIKITEIFLSIQGEADSVGWPTVFVRLTGCPLRCRYCDTQY